MTRVWVSDSQQATTYFKRVIVSHVSSMSWKLIYLTIFDEVCHIDERAGTVVSQVRIQTKENISLAVWHKLKFLTSSYTQRNLFEILLNQPKIRLCLPFSDWFGSERTSVWIQINQKMVNTIWFRFDLIRFRKDFSVTLPHVMIADQLTLYFVLIFFLC